MTDQNVRKQYDVADIHDAPRIPWSGQTYYEQWLADRGIPIHREFSVPDVRALTTGWWTEMNVAAAFVEMEGAGETNGAYVLHLRPAAPTTWTTRAFEEVFYVLEGTGVTTARRAGTSADCHWQAGSLFTVPVNSEYSHVASEDAVIYCVTAAPLVMNLFHDRDFVFGSRHDFADKPIDGFFDETGLLWSRDNRSHVWETNFVRDCRTIELPPSASRGGNGRILSIQLGDNALVAHVSEFPTDAYKKAHRHGPGAHVLTLSGRGYSLLWKNEFDEHVRIDWTDGALLVPPNFWWHQHFNIGDTPARYLAIRWGSPKHPLDHSYDNLATDRRSNGDQIEYDDQDPQVLQIYKESLAEQGEGVTRADSD
jgi:mannose-6-phosphate isomerase-like protein (cupin superfamily)/uncharacterized RmlC-like cupin family protein